MPADTLQFEHAIQAVFSICASPDVSAATAAACDRVPGSSFVGEFHDYFSAERRPQFPDTMKTANGCVALVDCDQDAELALATMGRLRTILPSHLHVVAVATLVDAGYLLRAMRVGCNEFLTKPADAAALAEALLRFQNAQLAEAAGPQSAGRVISLYGAKGGVGTTTLAVHLASNLARLHRKRTLFIDHHHELGHAALYLGLKDGQYHFEGLIRNIDRLDADLLNGFVATHKNGLQVLASPDGAALEHKSTPQEIQQVLNFLRSQYDYVIIDSSMVYKSIVPAMLDASDEVYLVATPDVSALRDLARRIEYLSLDEATTAKLRIVINRSTAEDAVTPDQIKAAIHFPVWISVPNNYAALLRSINAGEPIPPQHRSPFAQTIATWAERLLKNTAKATASPSLVKKSVSFWRSVLAKSA